MKKNETTVNTTGGVGFAGLLTLVFIVLKLLGKISWSWLWVLSPIWIGAILGLLFVIIAVIVVAVS